MSAGLPSDEVADDYKNSLEDLVANDRYQIGNLTVIAKENIEHAAAISRVLENHIQRAPPSRKLPALYVLDSIAKNVGTPYTVYFGRNLYNIFMNAYTLVDGNIRKKLDEMLKTWREPVPGSLSTIPVFPLKTSQTILDALGKARMAAQQARGQPGSAMGQRVAMNQGQPYRNTPTPPQGMSNYGRPVYQGLPQAPARNGNAVQYQNSQYPQQLQPNYNQQPPPTPQYQVPQYSNPQPQSVDLGALHHDIDDLIVNAKIECASYPTDQAARTKLSSLQSLKNIIESGKLSEKDLQDVRRSVSEQMSQQVIPRPTPPPVVSTPLPYQQPAIQPPIPLATPSFLNTSNLAELLRVTAKRDQPTPPVPISSLPFQISQATNTPPVVNATPVIPAENPLIAQLRASGLLPAAPTPPAMSTSLPFKPTLGVSNAVQPVRSSGFSTPFQLDNDVKFTSASIKIPRPQLLTSFFAARPNTCNTCGRRFTSDESGREKKARHLDWHFKTKTRMVEAERRGLNRSWYVDEREWISSREYEDDAGPPDETGNGSVLLQPSSAGKKKLEEFVRVPNDPVLRNAPCPIDQEKFESTWSEEVQDFIWKDAIKVGNRIYHASCYKEATKDRDREGGLTPMGAGRISTPDSVLGKRKAEDEFNSLKMRVKLEA